MQQQNRAERFPSPFLARNPCLRCLPHPHTALRGLPALAEHCAGLLVPRAAAHGQRAGSGSGLGAGSDAPAPTRDRSPGHGSPSRSSSVEASPPKVVRCVDIEACGQHVLVAQRGDDTVQLTCGRGRGSGGRGGSPQCPPPAGGQPSHSPEESSLRQQSENPKRTAKCRGNMSWIPRLPGEETGSAWIVSASSSPGWGERVELFSYLAVSAPFVIKVLISSSWPYLAATWRGVLPYLSAQSISLPGKGKPNAGEWILNSSPRQRPGSEGGSSCGREGRTSSPGCSDGCVPSQGHGW